jgi:hypothetical protein
MTILPTACTALAGDDIGDRDYSAVPAGIIGSSTAARDGTS